LSRVGSGSFGSSGGGFTLRGGGFLFGFFFVFTSRAS
jgi:hypothetical protein